MNGKEPFEQTVVPSYFIARTDFESCHSEFSNAKGKNRQLCCVSVFSQFTIHDIVFMRAYVQCSVFHIVHLTTISQVISLKTEKCFSYSFVVLKWKFLCQKPSNCLVKDMHSKFKMTTIEWIIRFFHFRFYGFDILNHHSHQTIVHLYIHKIYYYHVRNWPQVRKKREKNLNKCLTTWETYWVCLRKKFRFVYTKHGSSHPLFLSIHMNKRKLYFTVARQIFTNQMDPIRFVPFSARYCQQRAKPKSYSNGINIIRINLFVLNCWKFIQ